MSSSKKQTPRQQSSHGEKNQAHITGEQIRHYRIKRGLTQSQLGGMLGVTYPQAQNYEKGIGLSGWARGVTIAKILGISLIQLAGHNGKAKAKHPQENQNTTNK